MKPCVQQQQQQQQQGSDKKKHPQPQSHPHYKKDVIMPLESTEESNANYFVQLWLQQHLYVSDISAIVWQYTAPPPEVRL